MKQRSIRSHVGMAMRLALTLVCVGAAQVGSTASAQLPGSQLAASDQPVGSLQIGSGAQTPIYGFGFQVTNAFAFGSGGGAGKVEFHDIQVLRIPDASSPLLFDHAVRGTFLQPVTVTLFAVGRKLPPASYILGTAVVSAITNSGEGFERVSFRFDSITLDTGGVRSCFNIVTHEPC
jgi:hypothetical protein